MAIASRNSLLLGLGVVIGLSLGLGHDVLAGKTTALGADMPWQDAHVLAEVLERVKREYVNPVDDHQLLEAAVRGMVSSLDPYSAYLNGEEYDEIKISSSGQYSGVGIEVSMEEDQVVVIAPFEGSPAARAGIRSGDVIVTIDGVPVNSSNLDDTIGRMRGAEGTQVKIGILRQGSLDPIIFTLQRSKVELHSVKSQLLEPGIGYVRISQFSETTGDELNAGLKELRKRNNAPLKGLVLDMRDNPGGVLEAAVAVADAFIESGVIVTARGRTPDSKFEMDATPGDALNGAPIVVLVNNGSASAAEIVAGALKDQHRATLMGHTTFGKGSVQTIMPLSDDRAIKLTTSLYYTPSGVSINHRGIAPDIELPREAQPEAGRTAAEAPDAEVQRAVQELKKLPNTHSGDSNNRGDFLETIMGSTRSIEILCLVLAALVLLWSRALAQVPLAASVLLGCFAAAILLFRTRIFFPGKSRTRLVFESWTMVAFITGVLWLSGRAGSPLLNLYLLPVILSALTLGRLVTLLQLAAIAVCHLLLSMATPGVDVGSLQYASQIVGQLVPILLVAYLIMTLSADISEARERIENLAQVDPLTGLFNQRMFDELWQREHAKCAGDKSAYALLMVDVDKLSHINESFGHDAGNSVLTLVAQCLKRSIRASDHAARYGGDEFAVLLPGASLEVAEAVVKRIRHNVYKTTLDVRARMIRCTVSIGVANYPKDGRDTRDLLSAADRLMYRDKELRRAPSAVENV